MKTSFPELSRLLSPGIPFGVCDFAPLADHLLPCRKQSLLPPQAKRVIVLLFPYLLEKEYYKNINLSRYAVAADYHTIAGAYLDELVQKLQDAVPGYAFAAFCDNSPIPEVRAAALSGLGVIGRNGLLIHPVYGSYCFIGEVVTDLPLLPTGDKIRGCVGCGACERACPALALSGGKPDEKNCLSAVTQQKKDPTDRQLALMRRENTVWGCDRCQTVCPMNRGAKTTPLPPFRKNTIPVVTMTTPVDGRAYAWRGEKVIRRNLKLMYDTKPQSF